MRKAKRSAKELITTARLALHLGSIPHAKELIFAAAERGKDDANVLGSAYFLAASADLEDDPKVAQWIQKAAVLSGEDGPLQMMTLSDLLDRKPEWDRQVSEIWEMLICNELPMFLAAQALNKSLSDLMLFPALANPSESDPRRRGIIPAYSGQRQPLSPDNSRQIGMDATALLTLSFLDLLDEALMLLIRFTYRIQLLVGFLMKNRRLHSINQVGSGTHVRYVIYWPLVL